MAPKIARGSRPPRQAQHAGPALDFLSSSHTLHLLWDLARGSRPPRQAQHAGPALDFLSSSHTLHLLWDLLDKSDRAALFFTCRSIREAVLQLACRCSVTMDISEDSGTEVQQRFRSAAAGLQPVKEAAALCIRLLIEGPTQAPESQLAQHIHDLLLQPLCPAVTELAVMAPLTYDVQRLTTVGVAAPFLKDLWVHSTSTQLPVMPTPAIFQSLSHLSIIWGPGGQDTPPTQAQRNQFMTSLSLFMPQLDYLNLMSGDEVSIEELRLLFSAQPAPAAPALYSLMCENFSLTDAVVELLDKHAPNLEQLRVAAPSETPLTRPCSIPDLWFAMVYDLGDISNLPTTIGHITFDVRDNMRHDFVLRTEEDAEVMKAAASRLNEVRCRPDDLWVTIQRDPASDTPPDHQLKLKLEAAAAFPLIGTLDLSEILWTPAVAAQLLHLPDNFQHLNLGFIWLDWPQVTNKFDWGLLLARLPPSCSQCALDVQYNEDWPAAATYSCNHEDLRRFVAGAPKDRTAGTPLTVVLRGWIDEEMWLGVAESVLKAEVYPHVSCKWEKLLVEDTRQHASESE